MFKKLIGNIKKRIFRKKIDGAIDSIAGAYGIFGRHIESVGAECTKNSFKHVIEAEKFDDILEGAELMINGLQLVIGGLKTVDMKAISRENKAIAKASGMDAEMEAYSEKGFDGLKDLFLMFKDNSEDFGFKVGDDVTDEVAKNPNKWREETPEAVKSFNENLDRNMKNAS